MYYVYMLRCSDNSLYTGMTNDFEKRYNQHFSKSKDCAKYTRSRQVINVAALWKTDSKSDALKLECRIKQLPKIKKELLVSNPGLFKELFEDKLNYETYQYLNEALN